MDFKAIILISVSFLNLAMGVVVFFHNRKSIMSRWFGLFAFGLAVWSFCMMMYAFGPANQVGVYWWSIVLHFAGAFIAYSFFYFSLSYPEEKISFSYIWRFIFFLPLLAVFYFLFIDRQIITGVNFLPDSRQLIYGPFYPLYFIYFFVYMCSGSLALLKKSFSAKGILRSQVRTVFIGTLIPLIFSAVVNMFLPSIGDFRFAWTGPIFLLVVIGFIAYAIIKLKFLDVRIIATEIFSIFLVLAAFIQIFTSNSLSEIITRLVLFVITLFFAVLIIRSVLNEVSRREQMEALALKLQKTAAKLEAANKNLKKTSADLAKANQELKRLDEAKSEFLSIASHQLRTPLTIIKGYISMVQEGSYGAVSKKVNDVLSNVFAASERLIGLVETLLNISRIEAGRLELDLRPVDLSRVTENLVKDFQQRATDKKLKLSFFSEGKVPLVLTDEAKIKEVISNFLDNALKYTEKGEITASLHQESRSVVFACLDTGHGVEPEDLPRLFNKFVRGQGMMKVHTEGTGLGLYFARVLIENMGGRVWAESPGKNRGSKFCFSLPLADKGEAKKVK